MAFLSVGILNKIDFTENLSGRNILKFFKYSVGNLVLPQQNSYLVSGMGQNIVAPTSALPGWILTSRVAMES